MATLVHSIALRFQEDADRAQIEQFFRDARAAANAQPGCTAVFAGFDRNLSGGNWTGALVVLFGTEDDYRQYMASDAHKALGATYGSLIADKASTQFFDLD